MATSPGATEEAPYLKENLELVNEVSSIATDNPAFPPWFQAAGYGAPWDPTKEPTKRATNEVAYAVAEELGLLRTPRSSG